MSDLGQPKVHFNCHMHKIMHYITMCLMGIDINFQCCKLTFVYALVVATSYSCFYTFISL